MAKSLKQKIIDTIIETQKISQEDLDSAIALQRKQNISLEKALIQKNLVAEKDLLMLLVKELNIPFINLSKYKIDPTLQEIVPEKIARQYSIIPLSSLDFTVTVAVSDPLNVFLIDDLKNITSKEIDMVMATSEDIKNAINTFYGVPQSKSVMDITKDLEVDDFEIVIDKEQEESADTFIDESEKAPIIRMVNLVVKEAIKQRASDIHIEPMLDCMRVRYR